MLGAARGVNIRATARATWERLAAEGLSPLLLSGDMTPEHRLGVIGALKDNPVRVVVSAARRAELDRILVGNLLPAD